MRTGTSASGDSGGVLRLRAAPRPVTAVLGVLLVVVGGYLAVRPFASLTLLLLAIVGGLLVAAVAEVVSGRQDDDGSGPTRWRFVRAVAYLLGAVAVVAFTGLGVRAVIAAVGLALLAGGVGDFMEARTLRGVERWNCVLGGSASVIFGLLALAWPDVSVVVIGVVVGVRLLMLGLQLIGRAVAQARGAGDGAAAARAGGWRRWLRLAGNALALALAVVLVLVSLTLRRGAPEPDDFYSAPASVPAEPGQLVRSEPYTTKIPDGAQAWRILYTTTRDEGQPALASGIVVVPRDQAGSGIPVIAWAHGTTGAAPGCAPSVIDPFESGAFFSLDKVLAENWAYVGTDYVGLGTASPHPYLIGQGEGRSVLDAARAARQLEGVRLGEQTVVWGHSQGGHAALWTGMLAPTYAPELDIAGVAALAPASNLPGLIDNLGNVTGGELFASYVIDSYAKVYDDVRFEEYVRPGAQPIVREMAGRCLAEPSTLLSIGTIMAMDKTMWNGDPNRDAFAARLRHNIPTGPIPAPLLLGQGAADQLVVPAAQDAYVAERCAAGQQVDYRTYPGRDHVPLVEPDSPAITDLIEWTTQRLAGDPPTDTCS
jgi:uncharacterized membrane protein HdeD (DUF308 family)/acetyl esterase/lipase